jgi:chain length determinant protein tyrosine kinase EpsG
VTVSKVVNIPASLDDHGRAIGTILVDEGHLSKSDADVVDRYATENGLRFGEAAVQLKLLSHKDVQSALAQQFNYPVLLRGGEHGVADDVVACYDPQNDIVEPLRALRSQLTLRWLNLAQRKALAITSPNRGDGRSWLAANLATVFAQGGNRTLLIDTDMRHPSQHRLFNVDNAVGLSALLTGRAGGRDVIRRIHPSLRLFVLPAGILPPNPQELLVRPIFANLLVRLSKMFEVVILDTPAATETADAQILAARAGAAVILARRNRTRVADLTAMTASLTDTGASVIGSVANDH